MRTTPTFRSQALTRYNPKGMAARLRELETGYLAPGTRIGDHVIVGRLASGGFADVYEARHERLAARRVIKVLQRRFAEDADVQARFLREARILADTRHEHLIVVHDVGTHEGRAFIAMEYLAGQTLRARLKHGPLRVTEALRIAIDCAGALAALHGADVVHRDVKPANIFIGPGGQATLLDLGCARDMRVNGGKPSVKVFGTPAYMAPELIAGESFDGRADVYSLGLVLYEMLTGKATFGRPGFSAEAVFDLQLHEPAVRVRKLAPWIAPELARLVEKSIQKAPRRRHETAAALGQALLGAYEAESTASHRPIVQRGRAALAGQRLAVWCVVGFAIGALATFALGAAYGRIQPWP